MVGDKILSINGIEVVAVTDENPRPMPRSRTAPAILKKLQVMCRVDFVIERKPAKRPMSLWVKKNPLVALLCPHGLWMDKAKEEEPRRGHRQEEGIAKDCGPPLARRSAKG